MTAGILRGIEDGWFTAQHRRGRVRLPAGAGEGRQEDRRGQRHTGTVAKELEILRVSHEVEVEQRRELAARKADRDEARGRGGAATGWSTVARTDENMIPAMLDAARAEATLGEICDALRAEWGIYREPARF